LRTRCCVHIHPDRRSLLERIDGSRKVLFIVSLTFEPAGEEHLLDMSVIRAIPLVAGVAVSERRSKTVYDTVLRTAFTLADGTHPGGP